jgi:AcrR family transcriptional regulator
VYDRVTDVHRRFFIPAEPRTRPARQTRKRILETTLALYNDLGEPNVSTTLIATEVGISAGNLHYHFRKKDQLIAALLEQFVGEVEDLLPPETWRARDVEDAWFLLHVIFETILKYRFLFRDLSGIMSRDRRAGHRLTAVFARAVDTSRGICLGLAESGQLEATPAEIEALARNVTVLTLYWLSFDTVRNPRRDQPGDAIAAGVYQVLMLVAPFMKVTGRANLEYLASQYLSRGS